MAYYFPNLDETTRLNMIAELERDINNGSFYNPLSLNDYGLTLYPDILRISFEKGNCTSIENYLQPNMFRMRNKNNNKVSSNITSMLAFNDFNRYYIRAMIVRAIDEEKGLYVYRAKKSIVEREESKTLIGKIIIQKENMIKLLNIYRNYQLLFSKQYQTGLLLPNSGLSLMLQI